jgi:hypothetical protein
MLHDVCSGLWRRAEASKGLQDLAAKDYISAPRFDKRPDSGQLPNRGVQIPAAIIRVLEILQPALEERGG